MKIKELLDYTAQRNASDLYVNATKRPAIKLNGEVILFEDESIISSEEVDLFRNEVISTLDAENYKKYGTCDIGYQLNENLRFRINFMRSNGKSCFVARPIKVASNLNYQELGLPNVVQDFCNAPRGIIIVTGATGSGKSTTLSAMVNYINSNFRKHIITVEDPIEFIHSDKLSRVTQRELNTDTNSFAQALKSAMRESPDVITIGEMRDAETVAAAITASLTGHLVITTVHTSDAIQVVERIINLFPDEQRLLIAQDLANALIGVVAQRLLPKVDKSAMVLAVETLVGTSMVKKLVAKCDYRGLEEAIKRGTNLGMMTFNRAIFKAYSENKITLETALAVVDNPDEFKLQLKGMESGVDSFVNHYGTEDDSITSNFIDMHRLLRTAVKIGASDLHLSSGAIPTLRIGGVLQPLDLPELNSNDVQKLLYSILTPKQKLELETNREIDFALSVTLQDNDFSTEKNHRFRINAYFQRGQMGVAARIVKSIIPSPAELSIPMQLVNFMNKQQGLILITGPTGSGKSTTMASLINEVNISRSAHIITIEDPIEYIHNNKQALVEQREVHADTLSFSNALKSALRQDPDIILVGEMRDLETIAAAITAAETGHLVLATLHTNSAPQTIDRIIDSFPSHQQNQIRLQLASVILSVVSQRLLIRKDGNGLAAAFEIMVGTPPVQALIREGKTSQLKSVIETGYRDGMITLERSLEELYDKGLVSRKELESFSSEYKVQKAF